MYKFLLCWRYLRTRYIALVSVISVTLGVATMVVVNSVMEGFSSEMQNRIHGILSDVVFTGASLNGFSNVGWHESKIREVAGDQIEAISPTVFVPAMLFYDFAGQSLTQQVQLIGIDEKTQSLVGDFGRYLQHPENRRAMNFELRRGGYDVRNHESGGDAPERLQMRKAGWEHRKEMARDVKFREHCLHNETRVPAPMLSGDAGKSKSAGEATPVQDPFAVGATKEKENVFDPAKQTHTGAVIGIAMAGYRLPNGEDRFKVLPGDDVKIAFLGAGDKPDIKGDYFTVVDFYESKMSEYDSTFVFVPIRELQRVRGMIDPTTKEGRINAFQIKLKPGADGEAVRDKLQAAFGNGLYRVETWRDRQGALLAAVQMEKRILNLLLFLIIAVAGFGILAIFYMIVVEKTRDIGILKSLGAPGHGVMGIFLAYGLSLGLVGSGVGLLLGLLFVRYINEIADGLGWLTGHPVFDPSIYYFYRIPAIVLPGTIAWIVIGALGIAVASSILPARRAARLHPVEALRYE
ncbi:MAG: FtsX-like permease family protein [Thermoguttaceae bacterium]